MPNLTKLIKAEDYPELAQELLNFSFDEWKISGEDLEKNPQDCLAISGVTFRKIPPPENRDSGQCEFGRYDDMEAEIILFPAKTEERNAFTLMHEFAHHVQASWSEWNEALIESELSTEIVKSVNEHVADSFAGHIVAYSGGARPDESDIAGWMVRTYNVHESCSAQAMLMTTAETISRPVLLVLISDDGHVIASKSCNRGLAPAPHDSVQSSIGLLATESRHSGRTETGKVNIKYKSNSILDSLRAQVHAIPNENRAFAVISDVNKSGRQSWTYEEHDCSNPACNQHFTVNKNIRLCPTCGSPRCPECGSCDCDLDNLPTVCPNCFMQYSIVEQNNPKLHECLY